MATRIQRMFRNYKISSLSGVTRRLLLKRKLVGFSDLSNELLTSLLDNDNSNNGISGKSCYYINPGIRQNTPQFNRLLNQHTIYCNRFFTSDDAVLLSAVLRNTLSRTRRLIMHCVNGIHSNFEFDLISAISQCRSLRFIAFLGGIWSARFLEKIYQKVQLENPLIQSILVEGVHGLKTHELDIVISSTSNLLLDFFNYSVPGIQTITLQGLSLVSEDMKLLAKGLKVNTSLKYLSVSLNLIEDDGFYEIFLALSNSKKSSLTYLDFSWNLVSLTDSSIIKLFDSFSLPSLPDKLLTINLLHNRITSPYKPIKQFRNDLIVKIIEEVEENQNIKINKGNEDESYRYNKNNNNFKNNSNNLKTIKSENINKISKVKSSLMKKVNYNINIK